MAEDGCRILNATMKQNIFPTTPLRAGLAGLLLGCCTQTITMAAPAGWTLVWSDEFDGASINSQNWTFDLGGGGWGNNELEYYTDRPENARIENGSLVIEARAERYRNRAYTSARLKTQGRRAWTYGRVEARIRLPQGQGIWPAFWMLGDDITTIGWPNCGEVDIMENIGREPNFVHGTVHGPGYSGADSVGGFLDAQTPLANGYHLYAVEWSPDRIEWYLDDATYFDVVPGDLPGPWVFDHPFFLILNVAVGGYWPGNPDGTTVFPQKMLVDYVRVYQSDSAPPPPGTTMHVAAFAMTANATGPNWQAVAALNIADHQGQPVGGATVTGEWSDLVTGGNTSFVTDANGDVGPFYSHKTRASGTITFCVTSITKSGALYDSGGNVQTCGSVNR